MEDSKLPKFKVIANYPDNKDFPVGEIICCNVKWPGGFKFIVEDCQGVREYADIFFERFPQIFKRIVETAPLLNSDKKAQECDATAAPLISEPLAQKNPLEDITECYVPEWVIQCIEDNIREYGRLTRDSKVSGDVYKKWGEGWAENKKLLEWIKKITLPAVAVKDDWISVEENVIDEIAGIMYKNKTDEADDGSWIEGKDFHKVAKLIVEWLDVKRNQLRWLNEVKAEQKNYPMFKGKELNEKALIDLHGQGKTPIEALNDLSTIC